MQSIRQAVSRAAAVAQTSVRTITTPASGAALPAGTVLPGGALPTGTALPDGKASVSVTPKASIVPPHYDTEDAIPGREKKPAGVLNKYFRSENSVAVGEALKNYPKSAIPEGSPKNIPAWDASS